MAGLVQDTLAADGPPIAVAHVDCDWYDPVLHCLDVMWARLSPGGVIVVDDYDAWSGCRKAVDEFVAGHDALVERRSRLHVVKPD